MIEQGPGLTWRACSISGHTRSKASGRVRQVCGALTWLGRFPDPRYLRAGGPVRIAAFDGENADPALARKGGYARAHVRNSDESRISPGAAGFRGSSRRSDGHRAGAVELTY